MILEFIPQKNPTPTAPTAPTVAFPGFRRAHLGQTIMPHVGVAIIAFPVVHPPGLEVPKESRGAYDAWWSGRGDRLVDLGSLKEIGRKHEETIYIYINV